MLDLVSSSHKSITKEVLCLLVDKLLNWSEHKVMTGEWSTFYESGIFIA